MVEVIGCVKIVLAHNYKFEKKFERIEKKSIIVQRSDDLDPAIMLNGTFPNLKKPIQEKK